MPDDPRVQSLLDELLDSPATPEEVCRSCPELLPQVRQRWRQVCQAQAELDALFPPAPEPGRTLPAPASDATSLPVIPGYVVEAVLGLGGMGVVFRARHLRLGRVVALKMALAGAYAGPQERERFHREAEAVAAMRHPNVVQVHDVGDSEGRPYFTMEYVEGGTLAQKLAGTPLPGREAAALVATLAGAVQAAHAAGIVHRDLKPANVLLTADGTPKISDFGIARRLGGEAGLTRTGAAVGTPSYMAPEQAQGKAAGPAVDVYALGAILYELLTGRPPFRGETVCQVISQNPVPPSRLNAWVSRDLETVCLNCLHKEPLLRYASAVALADDLNRFLRGEAVAARPEGRLARVARQVRRRPVLSATVAVAFLSTGLLIAGGVWAVTERQAAERTADLKQAAADAELRAIERASDADLCEMEDSLTRCFWPAATAALERAKSRLGGRGAADLHQRIRRGTRDLELVTRWEFIRLNSFVMRVDVGGQERLDASQADGEYEAAFHAAGFGRVHDDPAAVAARVRASHLRTFLAAELDYWAMMNRPDSGRRRWLLDVARGADVDATGWSARAMIRTNWQDESSIGKLVEAAPPEYPPLLILLKIDRAMTDLGKDPAPLMRRYQQAHSGNFWVNLRLADILSTRKNPEEAIRYYQAALAARPKTSVVCNNLGIALAAAGRREEALEQYRRAVEFDPSSRQVRANLAVLLSRSSRHAEAIEEARAALRIDVRKDPATAGLYAALGHSLKETGRADEALEALRKAVALDARHLAAQSGLRDLLMRQGKKDEARVAWGAALEADPPEHDAWYGYAELCLFLGHEDEYRRARSALLRKFGSSTAPAVAERTGRACLLLPASGDELRQAVALADRAAAADTSKSGWARPFYLFVQGLAEYRRGRFDRAVTAMRGDASRVLGPAPRLVLAMALHESGQVAEARKALAAAVASHDWRLAQVRDQDGGIYHALRREAERMILPSLPAFLEGKHQPRDNDERLAMLGACQFESRTHAAARLYADAFAADPQLEDLGAGNRSRAASYAALAGCGRGKGAAGLGEPERAKWRAQARAWLRADLAAWGKALAGDRAPTSDSVREWLTHWRADPDLAGLREPAELEKLPADERKDCLAFWAEVQGLLDRCGKPR